jgi:hypothetical protein
VVADAGCASVASFLDALHRRSSRVRPAGSDENAARLEIELESAGNRVQGTLRLHHEDGGTSTRHVTGVSCEAVVDALALTAALALDSAGADHENPQARAGSDTTSPPPSARPARDAAAATPASPDRARTEQGTTRHGAELGALRAELGAHAAVARLVAPHLNVGGAVVARLRLERGRPLSPALGLSLLHTDNGLFESSRHVSVQVTGIHASLCALRIRPLPDIRLEPCLSALGARLRASGRNLLDAREVERSFWGAGLLARLALGLGAGVSVEVEAGALKPLVSRRFVALPGQTSLGDTSGVAPFANLGIIYVL